MIAWKPSARPGLAIGLAIALIAPAGAAPVPMIANGRLVGITGLGDSGCTDENCGASIDVGTIVSVDHQAKTGLPIGFRLKGLHGLRYQTLDADWQGASMLDVRRIQKFLAADREVVVIGRRSVDPQMTVPSAIVTVAFTQGLIDASGDLAKKDAAKKPADKPK